MIGSEIVKITLSKKNKKRFQKHKKLIKRKKKNEKECNSFFSGFKLF